MPFTGVALEQIFAKMFRFAESPLSPFELVNADELYTLTAPLHDGSDVNFSEDVTGDYVYCAPFSVRGEFKGNANVSVDKLSKITFELHKNGELVPGAFTPLTMEHANITLPLSIHMPFILQCNDCLQVKAKSSVANTNIIIESIQISYQGYMRGV